MLNANEIKNVKFAKAMGGYKQEEVDILLDKIETDYLQFERSIKEYESKIKSLEEKIEELKASQDSIQSVLVSAQGLADRIVNEAKVKSDEIIKSAEKNIVAITEQEKQLAEGFELKAKERKENLEKELADMIKTAELKAESITAAATDSVERQQILFDKLKMEVAAFKSAISAKYKEHLEILSQVPDSVPNDPVYMAKVVSAAIDNAPKAEDFIPEPEIPDISDITNAIAEAAEMAEAEEDDSTGFKVDLTEE